VPVREVDTAPRPPPSTDGSNLADRGVCGISASTRKSDGIPESMEREKLMTGPMASADGPHQDIDAMRENARAGR